MASIQKHRNGWRAQIKIDGVRESACFDHKCDAEAWALGRETELKALKRTIISAKNIAKTKNRFLTWSSTYSQQEIISASAPVSNVSGVYFLIQNEIIVYVGQSTNVGRRIADHMSTKAFDRFAVIECEQEELSKLESHYIKEFRPILNIVGIDRRDDRSMIEDLIAVAD